MEAPAAAPFTAADLLRLAQQAPASPCPTCAALRCPGWESMPGGFDAGVLGCVGTLRGEDAEAATLAEYHPAGTHGWSPDAPIAPGWFPYNRCTVWACRDCGRLFLRYTEYGGYYNDERIRELDARRVVATDGPGPGQA